MFPLKPSFSKLFARYADWISRLSKLRSRQGLYEFLAREYSLIPKNSMVFTVGSGGEVNWLLTQYAEQIGFQIISIDIAPARTPNIVGDICRAPVSADTFDCVVMSEVLEHLQSPTDGVKTLQRILKSGGKLVLTTPFMLPMHDRPHDYYRFTKHGLEFLLREFCNVDIQARNTYFEAIDVLWVRLLQTDRKANGLLCLILIPLIFFLKRPITLLLANFFQSDAMTTGYVVTAYKP